MRIEIHFIAEVDKDVETLKLLDDSIKTSKVEIKLEVDLWESEKIRSS